MMSDISFTSQMEILTSLFGIDVNESSLESIHQNKNGHTIHGTELTFEKELHSILG